MGLARAVVSVVFVAGLSALGWYSFRSGTEGTLVSDVTATVGGWRSTRLPTRSQWLALRDELRSLMREDSNDPAAHELLAITDDRLANDTATSRQEYLSEAVVQLRKALELRPMSPYSWANLASVEYRLGDTGKTFRSALIRAVELGPQEPEVQQIVAEYGLAVWSEADAELKTAVESSVAAGMRRQPRQMLQIAERRGRLAVPCRHVDGTPRQSDTKWLQPCQSTEATP